ncbi:hypothetical protein HOD75_02450 [archaeon]|jgi:hypothetical protein|nr:hypothetical protein [archaeon]MBT4241739.1 hypothetical protein [archaeon]MBT4418287.1 hypothetical protein [archaeon]
MKKRKEVDTNGFSNVNTDLEWGSKGLKISLLVLTLVVLILFVVLYVFLGSVSEIGEILFRMPEGQEYLAIFGGALLFIAVPFLLGIKVGFHLERE